MYYFFLFKDNGMAKVGEYNAYTKTINLAKGTQVRWLSKYTFTILILLYQIKS